MLTNFRGPRNGGGSVASGKQIDTKCDMIKLFTGFENEDQNRNPRGCLGGFGLACLFSVKDILAGWLFSPVKTEHNKDYSGDLKHCKIFICQISVRGRGEGLYLYI